MSKHTPGPWALEEVDSDTGNFKHLVPVAEIGEEVISLLTVVEHNGQNFAAVYSKSDAKLFAAAPDLLEALRYCSAVCAGEITSKSGLVNALEKARSAMQKATGK